MHRPAISWNLRGLLCAVLVPAMLTTAALANPKESASWFAGLTVDQRADLQGNLVLLAHYGGMVDSEFGGGTYNALISWQQSAGLRANGVLTEAQMTLLEQMASDVMSDLGISLVEDLDAHLAIMLPKALLFRQQAQGNGTLYQNASGDFSTETFWRPASSGTLAQQYAEASTPLVGRTVTYRTLRDDLYVVTGMEGGHYFYELVHADAAGTSGFRFSYSDGFKEIGGVASVFAASYSAPISAAEVAIVPGSAAQPTAPTTTVVPPTDFSPSTAPATKDKGSSAHAGVSEYGSFIAIKDAPGILALIGDIGPSTPLDFRRAVRALGKPTALVLASDGGLVASALMVAYEVHEMGLPTYVLPDTGCYSACSFIFLAGSERLAEGELGVHQVWGEQTDASSAQTVVSDILEAFGEFGVRQEVTSAMLRTRPEDMYVFDSAELVQWGLNSP